jgi:hypothetical protein
MSSERPEEFSQPPVSRGRQSSDDRRDSDAGNHGPSDDATRRIATVVVRGEESPPKDSPHKGTEASADRRGSETTVVVRGETVRNQEPKSPPKDPVSKNSQSKDKEETREVSEAKIKMQSRLPVLDDDPDVGVQKQHLVTRDGKADLAFTGTLLGSAAPPSAPTGKWQEYRIYETNGGKHVFSKVTRSVFAQEQDTHQAEVFDPSPSSVPSQLLRSARDLARSRPLTWVDAAADFFGYDLLAKALYRKLSGQFEEHIT